MMQTKNIVTILAAMAMAGESLAFNAHRHVHKVRELEARGRHKHIDWVTVWETVTVYGNEDGEVKTVGSDTFFANSKPERKEDYAPVVLSVDAAAAAPTTLATSVKAAESPAETPAPEAPPAPIVQAPVEVSAEVPDVNNAAADAPTQNTAAQVPASGKRGLAYNDGNLVNNFASNSKCSWAYNWDSTHNGLKASLEFVPMLWGNIPVHTNRWKQNADKMISEGSTHLLSFNEPDHHEQANMSPQDAARAHVEYMNPYADKARIGSPAITNSNIPGQSIDWLKEWVSACKSTGCKYDFCVAHWYAPASVSVQDVEGYLRGVHEACEGKPVWLTEFAPSGSDAEINDFLSKNLANFDKLDFLERYSYFMMSVGSLMSSDNAPSTYGRTYFGLTS